MNYIQTLAQLAKNIAEKQQLLDMKNLLHQALKENILSLHQGKMLYLYAKKIKNKLSSKTTLPILRQKREEAHNAICNNIQAAYLPCHMEGIKQLIDNAIVLGVVSPSEYLQIDYLYKQKQTEIRKGLHQEYAWV